MVRGVGVYSPYLLLVFPLTLLAMWCIHGSIPCTRANIRNALKAGRSIIISPDGNRIGYTLFFGSDIIRDDPPFAIIKYALEVGHMIRVLYVIDNHVRRRFVIPVPWESYGMIEIVYQCPRIVAPTRDDVALHHNRLMRSVIEECKQVGICVNASKRS